MKYERFEELPVWNAAMELAQTVYALTASSQFKGRFSLRDQLERAALSVSNNIAEGFERGTTNEPIAFIYIARGSAGEVRSILSLLDRLPMFRDLKSEISNLRSKSESCSRQLRAWANALQNSDIRGQRHLTAQSRNADQKKRDREGFLKELAQMTEEGGRTRDSNQADSQI